MSMSSFEDLAAESAGQLGEMGAIHSDEIEMQSRLLKRDEKPVMDLGSNRRRGWLRSMLSAKRLIVFFVVVIAAICIYFYIQLTR